MLEELAAVDLPEAFVALQHRPMLGDQSLHLEVLEVVVEYSYQERESIGHPGVPFA